MSDGPIHSDAANSLKERSDGNQESFQNLFENADDKRGDKFLNWPGIFVQIAAVAALFAFLVTAFFQLQSTNRQIQTEGTQSTAWQLNQVQVKLLHFINVLDRLYLPENMEIGFVEVQDIYEQLLVDIDRALASVNDAPTRMSMSASRSLTSLRDDLFDLHQTVEALEFSQYSEVFGIRLRMEGHATRIQRLPKEALEIQSEQLVRIQSQVAWITTQMVLYIMAILAIASILVYYLARVQQRAVEYQNYLITALDVLPDAFALFDERDRLTVSNERFRQEFDLNQAEITAEPTFRQLLERHVRVGLYPRALSEPSNWIRRRMSLHQSPSIPFQEQFRKERWVRVAEKRTMRGETVIIQADITELKNREAELSLSQARFKRLVETSFDGILVVQNQKIFSVNRRLADILGFEMAELEGNAFSDILDVVINREGGGNSSGWDQLLKENDINGVQVAANQKSGEKIYIEASVRTFKLATGKEKVWAIRDVTQRRQEEAELLRAKEAAEQGSRAKGDFLAMMSHEIRTPMNAVLGMTNLILDTELDARQYYYAETVRDSAEGLLTILNDMLDLTKLEAGKLVLEFVPFDFEHLVQRIVDLMAPHAAEKDLLLEADLKELSQRFLVGDPQRLRQVMLNLIGNAIKFTEHGRITIRVDQDLSKGQSADDQKVSLRLSVIDTGIGIGKDKISQLFTPFTQADADISRRFGGTGLGLAICKRIIEQMQGSITVTSTEGQGSTFLICVDLAVSDKKAIETLEEFDDDSEAKGAFLYRGNIAKGRSLGLSAGDPRFNLPDRTKKNTGPSILIVEDSPTNQAVVAAFLEPTDCSLTMVENGAEALQIIQEQTFDLVLMDLSMPIMDGLEATRKIRELGGEFSDLPIIALTANALQDDQTRCYDAGMNDYLSKPIQPRLLLEKLHFWSGIAKNPKIQSETTLDEAATVIHKNKEEGQRNAKANTRRQSESQSESHSVIQKQAQENVSFQNPTVEDEEAYAQQDSELDSSELVSMDVLDQLTADTSDDMVKVLVASYLEELEGHIKTLLEAVEAIDKDQVRHRAHTIKGSSATFGAMRLGLAAKLIENSCDRSNWTRVFQLSKRLPDLARQTTTLLKETLSIAQNVSSSDDIV